MQDFQSIPGLAGRLFGGAVPPDPRRARAQCGGAAAAAAPEEVKCPRCESTNTKFCYYNNYNLSQPRHFCKSCRRYWTKGGVLRNVPVGGGCRKSKRSPAASASSASASGPTTAASCSSSSTDAVKSANHPALAAPASYSSEDTSLPTATPKTVTASATSTSNAATAMSTSPDDPFATDFLPPPAPIFADPAAAFTYLFAAPPPPLPAFGFPPEPKTEGVASAFVEQASEPANAAAAIAADMTVLGWQPAAVDAGIFDLAGAVGDASPAYWNPGGWTDPDPTIYLP